MAKKVQDLKPEKDLKSINLRGSRDKKKKTKAEILKKEKSTLFKKKTPIKELKDLSDKKNNNYLYIKGQKFTPPKYLGSLIKIAAVGFLIILTINAINVYYIGKTLEREVSAQAYEGYSLLIDAGKSATKIQFENALEAFENARENFLEAENDLWFLSTDKTFYAKNGDVKRAVSALLEGGKHFAIAGGYFLEAIEHFNNIPLYFVSKNNDSAKSPSITDTLKAGLARTDLAIEEISLAAEEIKVINEEALPPEMRVRVSFAKKKVEEVAATLQATSEHFPALLKLLGDRYPHRYLILFQNNNEIRPTGGFIGSYAIMDINDGYIEKLETYDVYDLDGSYGGIIEPPEELKEFTKNWRFRDSNYSQDFPTSAQKARWFLQKEGGPTVDTVIAINQGLLKDMLEITGPVKVGDFGELNSENYNLLLTFVIEGKIWGADDPKHILKVFVKEFEKKILDEKNLSSIMSKLYKAVQQKHIMVYSADEEIQALFDSLGISGRVYENEKNEDYLSVINISTGGTKSDQFIEEKIHHHTHIDDLGTITDEVTIKRTHLWTDEIYYQWKKILNDYGFYTLPDQIIDIMGRGRNRVSVKVYVPAGSVLLASNGSDVETKYDKDLKKTYFFYEIEVKAGESDEIWIKYRLPYNLNLELADTYKLMVEKQPGSVGSIFDKTVSTSPDIYNMALYPSEARLKESGITTYSTNLVYDRYFSGVWGK